MARLVRGVAIIGLEMKKFRRTGGEVREPKGAPNHLEGNPQGLPRGVLRKK